MQRLPFRIRQRSECGEGDGKKPQNEKTTKGGGGDFQDEKDALKTFPPDPKVTAKARTRTKNSPSSKSIIYLKKKKKILHRQSVFQKLWLNVVLFSPFKEKRRKKETKTTTSG